MKKMFLAAVLVIISCTASIAQKLLAEGKTFSAFGDYKVEATDKTFSHEGKELEMFVISYQNTGMRINVAVEQNEKCRNYYVLSDNLAVKYVCNGTYFGVGLLGKDLEKEGFKTSMENMNSDAYFHQKAITCGGNTNMDNTKLIAAYYPFLIRNQTDMLAVH